MNPSRIFSLRTNSQFEKTALEIFKVQAEKNEVYKSYIKQLGINPDAAKSILQIPFLPIEFFKTHEVVSSQSSVVSGQSTVFHSSGTTGAERSKHIVQDISIYEKSFRKCFELFYGDIRQYAILALLPSYYSNPNSSLLYMAKDMIMRSKNKHSAFYNAKDETLWQVLKTRMKEKEKVILFGVSFALLDLALSSPLNPLSLRRGEKGKGVVWGEAGRGLLVIETGGMKGRREEITREELHNTLSEKFGVKKIHSEYGMTELLSQAYSTGGGIFNGPPWMKVFVRDANDPFSFLPHGKTGALNIIDLANINSCSFIATQDAGRTHKNGTFEVLGRMDNSDLRGCNLLIQ